MAQKAHPLSLRPTNPFYEGSTRWDKPKFFYIISIIQSLISNCCAGTNHYLNKIKIKRSLGFFLIETELIHFHSNPKKAFKSRRYKENRKRKKKVSWVLIACRLQKAAELVQKFIGTKKVVVRVKRLKIYTRNVPKPIRKQLSYYAKRYNLRKYHYARQGTQLIFLAVQNKATASALMRYIKQNIHSRQKRKKHYLFLQFLERAFEAVKDYKRIQGLKVQIKGRYAHRAKGRSQKWRYQLGQLAMTQLDNQVQAEYNYAYTGFGCVGLKIWISNHEKVIKNRCL